MQSGNCPAKDDLSASGARESDRDHIPNHDTNDTNLMRCDEIGDGSLGLMLRDLQRKTLPPAN